MKPQDYNECIKKLNSIASLDLNWNDDGATPFSADLIDKVKLFLEYLIEVPNIAITFNSTIQLKYDLGNRHLLIEFFENDIIEVSSCAFDDKLTFAFNQFYKVINLIKIFFYGKTNNVVLFTGAFNPPTIAHYHMINSVLNNKDKKFDYVIFAISTDEFLKKKQDKAGDWYFSASERMKMILSMISQEPKALLFGVENGYTYNVLNSVKDEYNCDNVYFACGSDKLNEIDHWGFHKKLLTEFSFYVLVRGNDEYKKVKNKCKKIFSNTNYIVSYDNEKYKDISATQVRRMIDNNEDCKDVLEEHVYKYLKGVKNGN